MATVLSDSQVWKTHLLSYYIRGNEIVATSKQKALFTPINKQ